MIAFDGKDYHRLWSCEDRGTETYSSITVGRFTDDDIPQFVCIVCKRHLASTRLGTQFLADGKNGKVLFVDSLGFIKTAPGNM